MVYLHRYVNEVLKNDPARVAELAEGLKAMEANYRAQLDADAQSWRDLVARCKAMHKAQPDMTPLSRDEILRLSGRATPKPEPSPQAQAYANAERLDRNAAAILGLLESEEMVIASTSRISVRLPNCTPVPASSPQILCAFVHRHFGLSITVEEALRVEGLAIAKTLG